MRDRLSPDQGPTKTPVSAYPADERKLVSDKLVATRSPAPDMAANQRSALHKRPMDLSIIFVSHALLFPIWTILWVAIPTIIVIASGRPVFHRQTRVGKNGRHFEMVKFRTMVNDAERVGTSWTVVDDPRITKFGRVLRKTALDELPQLFNILRGEMSFVGPKPLAVSEHEILSKAHPEFPKRLAVIPGLTGLAQVYDRQDEASTKLQYDLEYIARTSLWLDTKLVFLSGINTCLGRWDKRSGKPNGDKTD